MNTVPSAETDVCVEGGSAGASSWADGRGALGGVLDCGTIEEDGPVTWETLSSPRDDCGSRSAAPRSSEGDGVLKVHPEAREEARHLPRGRPKARGTGAEADGWQGVGGPNTSDDGGEGRGRTTHPSKGRAR